MVVIFTYGDAGVAADNQPGVCEEKIEAVQTSDLPIGEMVSQMLGLEERCADTGLYEYRLSKLYISAREYAKAAASIIQGLEVESTYEKELSLARGDIHLHQHNYQEAASEYQSVVEHFPDWYAGHDKLGFALFAQGQNEKAIASLSRSVKLEQTPGSYRTLVLAYYLTGQFEASTEALDRAYSLNETILADRDPMVAAIRSYAELGKYQVSHGLMGTLLQKNPEIRGDPEFIKAGLFLREKMIAAGVVVE